jgi:general secretion pathway protein K
MALLSVLLLVAVMAVVAATSIERLTLATRLAAAGNAMDQARQFSFASELLAARRISTLVQANASQVTLEGDWHGRAFDLPLPIAGGAAQLTVTDGGNCFNLNSLVADTTVGGATQRPDALAQFTALMQALGIEHDKAERISAAAADWIDPDQIVTGYGAEDESYANGPAPYRTANRPMADASELAAVAGMTPALWQRLRPWVCALPTSDMSPINVNTLLPEQAPLLQMLLPARLTPAQARAHIAARPASGWGSINAFWNAPSLQGVTPTGNVAAQVKLVTRWFQLHSIVRLGDVELASDSLIEADKGQVRIIRRRWSDAP